MEKRAFRISGFLALLVALAGGALATWLVIAGAGGDRDGPAAAALLCGDRAAQPVVNTVTLYG